MTIQANAEKAMKHIQVLDGLLGRVQAGTDIMINSSDGEALSEYMKGCLEDINTTIEKAKDELLDCHYSLEAKS